MNQAALIKNIQNLVPHSNDMLLIDQVIEKGSNNLKASVDLSAPSLFKTDEGLIPSYVGLEYMAQTISAFIGTRSLEQGEPIKLGFLLGTREYHTELCYFPKDETIIISAETIMMDDEFGVFDCKIITKDNVEIANAQLKAVQPDDISKIY